MDIFYAVNAIRKIQHIKPSTAKVYQYLKKLDKNLEEAHFKSTLESFVKNGYFVVQGEEEEESIFSVKSFEDMLEHFKQCTQENTRTEANDNYGILYERMITDLKSDIKFLRDQVASKDTFMKK